MKKILLGTVGLVALGMAAPASAADLAARPYTKAPADDRRDLRLERLLHRYQRRLGLEPQVLGRHRRRRRRVRRAREGCHDATGGTVGGQIGYRWQTARWVFGLEAQGNWADFKGSQCQPGCFAGCTNQHQDRRLRPVHRPGRLRLEQRPALREGRRCGHRRQATTAIVTGDRRARRPRRPKPAGAARSASVSNTASRRTGRSASNTTICSWAARTSRLHRRTARRRLGTDRIRQDVDMVTVRVNYRWGGPVVAKY